MQYPQCNAENACLTGMWQLGLKRKSDALLTTKEVALKGSNLPLTPARVRIRSLFFFIVGVVVAAAAAVAVVLEQL